MINEEIYSHETVVFNFRKICETINHRDTYFSFQNIDVMKSLFVAIRTVLNFYLDKRYLSPKSDDCKI